MAISKQDIFTAADKIFQQGEAPTIIKVRSLIGSGSFSTIGSYLAEWKASSRGEVVQSDDVPVDFVEKLQPLVAMIYSICQAESAAASLESVSDIQNKLARQEEILAEVDELLTQATYDNEKLIEKNLALYSDLAIVTERCNLSCERVSDISQEHAVLKATESQLRQAYENLLARTVAPDHGVVHAHDLPPKPLRTKQPRLKI